MFFFYRFVFLVILSHIRNIDIDQKEDGKTQLQLLDAYKNEFKVILQVYSTK